MSSPASDTDSSNGERPCENEQVWDELYGELEWKLGELGESLKAPDWSELKRDQIKEDLNYYEGYWEKIREKYNPDLDYQDMKREMNKWAQEKEEERDHPHYTSLSFKMMGMDGGSEYDKEEE